MATNRKFFPNNSVHSFEDLKKLVSDFQSFVFVANERAEAIQEMRDIISEYNAELYESKFAEITTAEQGIISAMIPEITLDTEKAKKSAYRKNAVYSAVNYTQYKITENNNGKHEIRKIEKPVTVRDINAYLLDLFKQSHADRKITKDDRTKATLRIVGTVEHLQAFRMFMHMAYLFENVKADIETFVTYRKLTEDEEKMLFAKPSKANAERQIKWLGETLGLSEINYRREHGLTLYKKTYTVDTKMQATVADVLNVVQAFIILTRYAKNSIELPETKDRAGLFSSAETAKETDDIITF